MNIVLFDPAEITTPLPPQDPRAMHVKKVLRRSVGDEFDVGLIDGPRGKAQIKSATDGAVTIPGRKLLDICRSLPDGSKLTIAQERDRVLVRAKSRAWSSSMA